MGCQHPGAPIVAAAATWRLPCPSSGPIFSELEGQAGARQAILSVHRLAALPHAPTTHRHLTAPPNVAPPATTTVAPYTIYDGKGNAYVLAVAILASVCCLTAEVDNHGDTAVRHRLVGYIDYPLDNPPTWTPPTAQTQSDRDASVCRRPGPANPPLAGQCPRLRELNVQLYALALGQSIELLEQDRCPTPPIGATQDRLCRDVLYAACNPHTTLWHAAVRPVPHPRRRTRRCPR